MFSSRNVRKRMQPRMDTLESRSLLSGVHALDSMNDQIVTSIFEHELHRDPTPRELRTDSKLLAQGVDPTAVAKALLVSSEYHATHKSNTAFVEGLYHDVLGRDADPKGEHFWVNALKEGKTTRGKVAQTFLHSSASFGSAPLVGNITNISATNGWTSGIIGGSTGFVAGTFNLGTPPTTITINVSAAGQYTLSQTNGSYIGNNSSKSWRGFTLSLLSSSTAGASFTSSSDASGHFPTVNRAATSINFSGGTVTSGFNSQVNGFQPLTTISTTKGGTIVILETPINA